MRSCWTLPLVLVFAGPLCAQTGSQIINDNTTEQVVEGTDEERSVAITLSPNGAAPDTTVTVREVDGTGGTIRTWELDGDGDGTGSFTLPVNHSVEVEDTQDEDNDHARVTFDVQ